MEKAKAIHLKDHLYDDVYSYHGHEIWICSETSTIEPYRKLFFYYIDGNEAVTKKQLLPWYPRFKTMNDAINHGQKRIENINLESALIKKLAL